MGEPRVALKPKKQGVVSKAIECKFCGHWYLTPCDDARQKTCPNTKLTKAQAKAKRTPK